MDVTRFTELNLSDERLAAVEALGWIVPTPIQAQAIPAGLNGIDVVGIAQTGTGKTGAFMIPALERIKAGAGLQVLALCPTRELAQQVSDDAAALARGTSIRSEAIFGGGGSRRWRTDMRSSWRRLAGSSITCSLSESI